LSITGNSDIKPPMITRREKLRHATIDEIKSIAWKTLKENQPVTIQRITREMGMTAPAFYTYFKNRDDLMEQLVCDALDSFYLALNTPDKKKNTGLRELFIRYREWAIAHPYAFSLFAGTPVFGFDAEGYPEKAVRIYRLILNFFRKADQKDLIAPEIKKQDIKNLDPAYVDELTSIRDQIYPDLDISLLHCAITLIIQAHGSISMELSARFNTMVTDWKIIYRAQIDAALKGMGL